MKKVSQGIIGLIVLCIVLLIAAAVWIFSKDGSYGVTGLQILGQYGAGFWIGMVIAAVIIFILVRLAIKKYAQSQDGSSVTPFLVAITIVFSIACIRGCDDKANGGVTTPKGRPVPTVKS